MYGPHSRITATLSSLLASCSSTAFTNCYHMSALVKLATKFRIGTSKPIHEPSKNVNYTLIQLTVVPILTASTRPDSTFAFFTTASIAISIPD